MNNAVPDRVERRADGCESSHELTLDEYTTICCEVLGEQHLVLVAKDSELETR
jgi:hypothetical protein